MTHTDIIWIVVTLTFSSTVGVYAAIRYTNLHTRPPVNTLVRSGDIELQEVMDSIQHINVRDIDLSSLPQYPQVMVNNPLPIRWEHPPRYSQLSSNLINSSLENNINLDFFPWVILFFISILIISLLIRKYRKEKLLLILILIWILKFGFFVKSVYTASILIPFSFFEIDFRDSFEWKFNSYRVKPQISYINLQTLTSDINLLMLSLEDDVNYSLGLSFISSYKKWKDNKEKIHPLWINDAIIVNKESDSLLITQFIMENLNKKGYFISDWLFNDYSINKMDPVILAVTVAIKVKI